MLVLSRKLGERIVIGPNIVVTVIGVRGDQVRLGVVAPAKVSIHREEVFDRIQQAERGPSRRRPGESSCLAECA
jgi:carbon storage regulator